MSWRKRRSGRVGWGWETAVVVLVVTVVWETTVVVSRGKERVCGVTV